MHFHDDIRVYIHQQFIVVLMGYSHESQDLEAVLWTISFFVLVAHGFCLNPSENWKIVFYVSNRTIWRRQSIQHSPHLLKKFKFFYHCKVSHSEVFALSWYCVFFPKTNSNSGWQDRCTWVAELWEHREIIQRVHMQIKEQSNSVLLLLSISTTSTNCAESLDR